MLTYLFIVIYKPYLNLSIKITKQINIFFDIYSINFNLDDRKDVYCKRLSIFENLFYRKFSGTIRTIAGWL